MTYLLADDEDQARLARANQTDPYIMHILVPRRPTCSLTEILSDVIKAVLSAWNEFSDHSDHAKNWQIWEQQSFRKITLTGRPSIIEAAQKQDHVQSGEVIIMPPVQKSQRKAFWNKAQTLSVPMGIPPWTCQLEALSFPLNEAVYVLESPWTMSLGKTISQLAHAVLLQRCLWDSDNDAWIANNAPGIVAILESDKWQQAEWPAVIDAGLTEVTANTKTIKVIPAGCQLPISDLNKII
jgi:peptidyl-tRNA hydrolase